MVILAKNWFFQQFKVNNLQNGRNILKICINVKSSQSIELLMYKPESSLRPKQKTPTIIKNIAK